MRKKVLIILAVVYLIIIGIRWGEVTLSSKLINHIEGNNFVNADDIDTDRVNMLHHLSKEIQVYSINNKEIHLTILDLSESFSLYINREFILQNESENYPLYQNKDYVVFSMDSNDYNKHRANLYRDIRKNESVEKYANSWFIGSYKSIINLIVIHSCVYVLSLIALLVASLWMAYLYRNQREFMLLVLASLSILYNIKIGIIIAVLMIHYSSDRLFKKRNKIVTLLITFLIGLILSYDFQLAYITAFLILSIINYHKNNNIRSLLSILAIAFMFSITSINYENSLFRIFYDELFIIGLSLFYISSCVLKLRNYFSQEKRVNVDLLREISHDLRLPLSIISLNTELLEKDDFNTEINKATILNTIKASIEDMIYMTSSLTAYISKEKYINKKYKTSIQDSIEQTVSYYKNNKKNIAIRTVLDNEELYLPIEKIWLNRLIFNLVDNAYKYSDSYGEITVVLKRVKRNIVLSIKDNGIGMTTEQKAKIMEPFYRADKSRSISGLGLGLSIVNKIVDNLDGDIRVESEFGVYTKFEIRI